MSALGHWADICIMMIQLKLAVLLARKMSAFSCNLRGGHGCGECGHTSISLRFRASIPERAGAIGVAKITSY